MQGTEIFSSDRWSGTRGSRFCHGFASTVCCFLMLSRHGYYLLSELPSWAEPVVYEQLFEGGSIEVSPSWKIQAGIDSAGGRGMRSVLESREIPPMRSFSEFSGRHTPIWRTVIADWCTLLCFCLRKPDGHDLALGFTL